jgi:YggT family protein
MPNYFQSVGVTLVQALFDLFMYIVLLRLMLQLLKANFYNPVAQGIVKVTEPLLQPMRRVIPAYRGIDTSPIVLLLLLSLVKILLITAVFGHGLTGIFGLLIGAIAGVLSQLMKLYFYLILIAVIMSWVNPMTRHPAMELLQQLTEPLLQPARRLIPPLGGFDLSPIAVLVAIKVIEMLIVVPLIMLAGI